MTAPHPFEYAESFIMEHGEDFAAAVAEAIRDLTSDDEVSGEPAVVEPSPAEVWAAQKAAERRADA